MTNVRDVKESPVEQGPNEAPAYTLTTTPWGGTPTVVSNTLKDSAGNDQASLLSGDPSVVGDVITTSVVTGLTLGESYLLAILFTNVDLNVVEAECEIHCK